MKGPLDTASRILNEVYWTPKRDVMGDDFEAIQEALETAADLRDAVRCFLSERDAIAHVTDLDAWTKRMELSVAHMREVLAETDGRQ